jgi:hypothetical protein
MQVKGMALGLRTFSTPNGKLEQVLDSVAKLENAASHLEA